MSYVDGKFAITDDGDDDEDDDEVEDDEEEERRWASGNDVEKGDDEGRDCCS